MLNKVLKAISDYGMIESKDKICVALSGGCDSVALLKLMMAVKNKFGIEISAMHINHCLRGDESDRDEQFVYRLCRSLDVPLEIKREDVSLMSGSTELNARRVRYHYFDEKISEGYKIATAHTASDNTETVLYNLTRGSMLSGVCGIPPVREGYIRPLIYCTRQDTENYAKEYVSDSSNLLDDYTRNIIRHRVVPVLKDINPGLDRSVSRMSTGLREIADFVNTEAEKALKNAVCEKGYDVHIFKRLHPAVAKAALYKAVSDGTGVVTDHLHISQLYHLLFEGNRLQLEGGYFACVCKGVLSFSKQPTAEKYQILLEKTQQVNSLLINEFIDCDKIKGKIILRTRTAGDSIKLTGRPTKTLKKLFNELAVPVFDRDVLPIVADDEGVIFVPFAGTAQRVAVDQNSKNILRATVVKK